jgi:hypothetical protein
MPATAKPKRYNPRHPERTLLYQTVAEHYESWLELACEGQFEGQGEYSTAKRTRIPRQSEHEFHSKANADSTAKRTGFPRESEQ